MDSFPFLPGSHPGEEEDQPEWADVQRKIIPCGLSADVDLEPGFQHRAARLGKSVSRLIVVASLIDKPTNLGGKVMAFQVVVLGIPVPLLPLWCVHVSPSWRASVERGMP
jgi:hypothetical protein